MNIELLGALDYKKVRKLLKEKLKLSEKSRKIDSIINELEELETGRKLEIVASAGKLSRFAGSVFDILGISEEKSMEENAKFVDRVICMGHDSITDHDYLVFAIKDVSPVVEQTIIEERFSSFTIKSRREVNFSNVGFYVPNFRDKDGSVLSNNKKIQKEYKEHMQWLFNSYQEFVDLGVSKEDARFVLPYSYHSNIFMGMDAHSLKDLIIKLTKTRYSKIQELKEFGDKLYRIAKDKIPYIIPLIDKVEVNDNSSVLEYLNSNCSKIDSYKILDKPKLINATNNVDETIAIAAIMRYRQLSYAEAKDYLAEAVSKNGKFIQELMHLIAFDSDSLELSQVNFSFQIPISLAVLTHLTRHRTHPIMTCGFVNLDLKQYQIPPVIKENYLDKYKSIFDKNIKVYKLFKDKYGVCDEDLVYFALSATMTNCLTNFDGKTLKHISRLRECTKAQWEIRKVLNSIHDQIKKLPGAINYSSVLGPTCMTQGICNEGKECCGLVYKLPNCKMPKPDSLE